MKLVGLVFFSFFFAGLGFADTLRMDKVLEGEHKANNKIWAKTKLRDGTDICRPWVDVCKNEPKKKCQSCAVIYLTGTERAKRMLTWHEKTSTWHAADGTPYDTALENLKHNVKANTVYDARAVERWKIVPGIWVLDTAGNFYTSVEQSPGKFHHSSFMAGGLVEGAGQVVFEKGKITHINNSSGHYKPDRPSFDEVLKKLHVPPIVNEEDDEHKDDSEKEELDSHPSTGKAIAEYDEYSSFFSSKRTNVRNSSESIPMGPGKYTLEDEEVDRYRLFYSAPN